MCSQDSDVIISGVQSGKPVLASLSDRVDNIRAMLLQPQSWLDDRAIDHAMTLLRVQYPHVGGLLSTTSLALLTPLPAPTQGFVQIMNICGNHWVVVGNVGCKVGEVSIFDSLHRTCTDDFAAQVTAILQFAGKTVRLQWPNVQGQKGGADCGLFAIANSLTLCRGEDPCMVQYHQDHMRTHLCSSLQAGQLAPFPSTRKSASAIPVYFMEVEVHCYCRRTVRRGKDAVVACGRCGEVFHQDCISPYSHLFICKKCTVIKVR